MRPALEQGCGEKLDVLIRDKISFVGVAHLTARGGRSCSWALDRPGLREANAER